MDQRQGTGRGYRGGQMARGRGRFRNRTRWDNRGVHFQEQAQSYDGVQSGQGRGQNTRGRGIKTRIGPGLKVTTGQGSRRIVQASKLGNIRGETDWFRIMVS